MTRTVFGLSAAALLLAVVPAPARAEDDSAAAKVFLSTLDGHLAAIHQAGFELGVSVGESIQGKDGALDKARSQAEKVDKLFEKIQGDVTRMKVPDSNVARDALRAYSRFIDVQETAFSVYAPEILQVLADKDLTAEQIKKKAFDLIDQIVKLENHRKPAWEKARKELMEHYKITPEEKG